MAAPNFQPPTPSGAAEVLELRRQGMTICDGQGGTLTLDLTRKELRWLVFACRRLLAGTVPPGASMLKVDIGITVYLLSCLPHADGAAEIRIADLYDPTQRAILPRDLAEIMAALLEQLLDLQSTGAHLDA
jgi:hypothetical protein